MKVLQVKEFFDDNAKMRPKEEKDVASGAKTAHAIADGYIGIYRIDAEMDWDLHKHEDASIFGAPVGP